MPHRRPAKKGSFNGHFDELVKQFGHKHRPKSPSDKPPRSKSQRDRSVHQALFEAASR